MDNLWNPANKTASICKWAENLHHQAKDVFLKDRTHAHLIFLFKDTGPVGINPVPPKTDHVQIYNAIRRTIKDNDLYAVIHIGEAWTYFRKSEKDHTAFQLLDGEIKVSELKDEDKSEALYLRMESADGNCIVYIDKIIRDGENVQLGEEMIIRDEDRKWF